MFCLDVSQGNNISEFKTVSKHLISESGVAGRLCSEIKY